MPETPYAFYIISGVVLMSSGAVWRLLIRYGARNKMW